MSGAVIVDVRSQQRIERDLHDQLGVQLGEDDERIADAFGAIAAALEQGDKRGCVGVGAEFAHEREDLVFMGDWWIIAGHWTPGGTPHRAARLPTDAGEVAF